MPISRIQWLLIADSIQEYQIRNEAELATQRTIAEGRRACVSLKHATTEDDLRDYFKSYAV